MTILEKKAPPVDLTEESTRERILNAAGEVFAELGFEGATVRAITQRAGVNVAAINYHFRDKAELYSRVIFDACAAQRVADAIIAEGIVDPQLRLRSIIFHWLQYMLDPARPQWKRLLLAREMANPTIALDQLVENSIRPMRDQCLKPTLRELTQDRFDEKQLRYISGSIMGQCQYYLQSRPVIDRLYPGFEIGKAEINELADHIARFSLAAITEMTRQERSNESSTNDTL
jgi:TetR/AcrR family transcriptional regulator, regulator of cefoperazone and chloramphenicol sensitivity